MSMIAHNVEQSDFLCTNLELEMNPEFEPTPQAIAHSAVTMAQDLGAKAILAFTHSGYTPRLLAKLRPEVPVIAISDCEKTCRKLNLCWDIYPYLKDWDVVLNDDLLKKIDKLLLEKTNYKKDERIILIGSIPHLITGRTNFMRVHRIGAI